MYIGDANIYHTNIVYDFCSPSPILYSLGTARIICTAAKEHKGRKKGQKEKLWILIMNIRYFISSAPLKLPLSNSPCFFVIGNKDWT